MSVQKIKNIQETVEIRSFLSQNLEVMLENLNVRKVANSNETEDLFDFGGEESSSNSTIPWRKDYKTLSTLQVLINEKDSLGLFVSGNPLENYKDFLHWLNQVLLSDKFHLVLINKVKKIFTKSNKFMVALDISTVNGEFEGMIFPKNALNLAPNLIEKELFWVRGGVLDKNKNRNRDKQENSLDETSEYVELPKIAVDNLNVFEKGVLSLITDEDNLSSQRREILEKINWIQVKENPLNFEEYINDESSQNLESKTIKISKNVSPEIIKKIKSLLHKNQQDQRQQKVKLTMQVGDEWKVVKGEFWADFEEVQKLLN